MTDHFPSAAEIRAEREQRERETREAEEAWRRKQADERARAEAAQAEEEAQNASAKEANLALLEEFAAKANELRVKPPRMGTSRWRRGFPVGDYYYLVVRRGRPRGWSRWEVVHKDNGTEEGGRYCTYPQVSLLAPDFMTLPTDRLRAALSPFLRPDR